MVAFEGRLKQGWSSAVKALNLSGECSADVRPHKYDIYQFPQHFNPRPSMFRARERLGEARMSLLPKSWLSHLCSSSCIWNLFVGIFVIVFCKMIKEGGRLVYTFSLSKKAIVWVEDGALPLEKYVFYLSQVFEPVFILLTEARAAEGGIFKDNKPIQSINMPLEKSQFIQYRFILVLTFMVTLHLGSILDNSCDVLRCTFDLELWHWH